MTAAPYQAGAVPISQLPPMPGIALASFDELAVVDVNVAETKKITAEAFLRGALDLLSPGSIDGNLIFYNTPPVVDPSQIPDGSITAIKLADNSSAVYGSQLPSSGEFVGQAAILSDGTVSFWTGSAWLQSSPGELNITGEELADNSSGVWTNENAPPSSNGNFVGQIAVLSNGKAYMWNGSEWYALSADVPDGSITAIKLSDNSSAVFYTEGTDDIQGAFTGQIAVDDVAGNAYAWTGSEWISLTSADAPTGSTGDVIDIVIDETTNEIQATLQATTGANEFLAGPIDGGGAATYRTIDPSDLPVGASNQPGVLSPGATLAVTGAGVVDLVVQGTAQQSEFHAVTYNEYGIVTSSSSLDDLLVIPPATDTEIGGISVGSGLQVDLDGVLSIDEDSLPLPVATGSQLGGVIIGGGIQVNPTGVISLDNNSVTAGTYSKVEVNEFGLVTEGFELTSDDLPNLDAGNITLGELDMNRIADGSVERRHLGDYSVTFIQESAPTLNVGAIGGLWLKESTGVLSVYNGNRWVVVSGSGSGGGGGGSPTTGLRYGGIVSAATGNLTTLTAEGTDAGFSEGSAPGSVADTNVGIYFVVNPAGSSISEVSGQAFAVGDWLLAASLAEGWTWVDRSGNGGGGLDPSTITLNQLADVEADSPVNGDCVIYNQSGGVYETRKIELNEIGNVTLTNLQNNQVLKYSGGAWINSSASGGVISSDAPSDGKQYARQNEAWTEVVIPDPPTGETVQVGEAPPTSPTVGMVWLRPSTLRQYVYMTDEGGSSQWASVMCC